MRLAHRLHDDAIQVHDDEARFQDTAKQVRDNAVRAQDNGVGVRDNAVRAQDNAAKFTTASTLPRRGRTNVMDEASVFHEGEQTLQA